MHYLTIIFICMVTIWAEGPLVVPVKNSGPRIINGEKAVDGQFPWQVAIYIIHAGTAQLCGGALIDSRWILTVAHCLQDSRGLIFYLGSNQLNGDDSDQVTFELFDYIQHENFTISTLSNDIALIPIPETIHVPLSSKIQPVGLPTKNLDVGTTVTVSGWGTTSDGGVVASDDLYYIDLVTISDDKCRDAYEGTLTNGVVCAAGGGEQIKSTYEGDSGSPMVIIDDDGTATQVGIASYRHPDGCESGKPVGFVDVNYYRDWITEQTGL